MNTGTALQPPVWACDPGIKGGMALVGWDRRLITAQRTPTIMLGKQTLVNSYEVGAWLAGWHPGILVIERVHSMPRQGVKSMFTFGTAYGTVFGMRWDVGAKHLSCFSKEVERTVRAQQL